MARTIYAHKLTTTENLSTKSRFVCCRNALTTTAQINGLGDIHTQANTKNLSTKCMFVATARSRGSNSNTLLKFAQVS